MLPCHHSNVPSPAPTSLTAVGKHAQLPLGLLMLELGTGLIVMVFMSLRLEQFVVVFVTFTLKLSLAGVVVLEFEKAIVEALEPYGAPPFVHSYVCPPAGFCTDKTYDPQAEALAPARLNVESGRGLNVTGITMLFEKQPVTGFVILTL